MATRGGARKGAGRKSLMDTNNFYGWLDEVIVAYLNYDGYGTETKVLGPVINLHRRAKVDPNGPDTAENTHWVVQKGPLCAAVGGDIRLSLKEVERAFGKAGKEAFRQFFLVSEGSNFDGLDPASRAVISTDHDAREYLMQYIEGAGLLPRIRQGEFTFVAGHRAARLRHKERQDRELFKRKLEERRTLDAVQS